MIRAPPSNRKRSPCQAQAAVSTQPRSAGVKSQSTAGAQRPSVAEARKVRPVYLERQPRAQRHTTMLATLTRPALELVTSNLIRTWLLKKYAGMLADFLDGMFDACPATTHIVDAWEGAYTYKKPSQYQNAYESIKVKLAERAADPEKYRRHFSAGFGIWMDCNWRQAGWHTDDSAKNFHPPADFEASVRHALKQSDEYVWIYTEQPKWWTNEKLPPAYTEALRKARESVK